MYHPLWQNIVEAYFKAKGFVSHQIDSYNEFVEKWKEYIDNRLEKSSF